MPAPKYDIEQLPQPYLAGFLDPSFEYTPDHKAIFESDPLAYGADYPEMDAAERKLVWPLRNAFLKACHLPEDYDQFDNNAKRAARMHVFRSYWNPDKPAELVSSVKNAVASMFLWNELYEKACEYGRGLYTMRDGQFKYELVSAALSPPIVPTEPAKTAIHVVRGGTKTTTLIRQLAKFLCITRPYTDILIVEVNGDRTKEEIQKIAKDVEANELIHADFGGRGDLFPKTSTNTHRWSTDRLDFKHLPDCSIMGYGFKAGQLGRHPKLILLDDIEGVDDPEKDGSTKKRNVMDRRAIFRLIFKTFRYMLYAGGKLVWFGNARAGTCLETALADANDQTTMELADPRFDTWRKLRFKMIYTGADGRRRSRMPDHTSVEAYEIAKQASGASVVGSEIDGEDVPDGESMLVRNPYGHGYMHCIREFPGGLSEEYMLDLCTWREMPWDAFLKSLYVASACDPAQSKSNDADLGAWVCVGVNPDSIRYVLDLDLAKLSADDWPARAYANAAGWHCAKVGWETTCFQTLVLSRAKEIELSLEADGFIEVPSSVAVKNESRNKHLRVLNTLRPLYLKNLIRFPRQTPVIGPDGRTHYPAAQGVKLDQWNELVKELDGYTSEGAGTKYDDAADALQMAVRAAGYSTGNEGKATDETQQSIERWRKRGIEWPAWMLPEGYRPEQPPPVSVPQVSGKHRGGYFEVDPYG